VCGGDNIGVNVASQGFPCQKSTIRAHQKPVVLPVGRDDAASGSRRRSRVDPESLANHNGTRTSGRGLQGTGGGSADEAMSLRRPPIFAPQSLGASQPAAWAAPSCALKRWLGRLLTPWLLLLVGVGTVAAEMPAPQATPEELGLRLPAAPPLPGGDRRVVVGHDDDSPTVARVYLEVGDHFVLLMPDGSLISRPQRKTPLTDRPFEPLDKKQLAKRLTSERFAGFRTRTTRRYLYVYNTSDAFAMATSRILETMYTPLFNYCRRQKLPVADPPFPLVVIMFRTQEEFEKYREVPPGLVAYYNGLSNHVVMFEQSKLAEVAPELAFKQAVSTIAHEGVHQILHNIGVQQRLSRWPLWFSEGLAEYFAPTEIDRRVRWKGVGLMNDLRLHELSEFYKSRQGRSTNGQLIRQAIEANTLNSLGYATSWSLIHYLARFQRDEFRECLQAVSRIEPLQSVASGSVFARHVSLDYAKVERDLISYLKTLPYVDPVLNQTHYVMFVQGDSRQALVTSSPVELEKYHRENASKGAYRIQAFPNRIDAEVFMHRWLNQP
jgi:hypothetical protein